MSFEGNEINDKEVIKPNENISEEEIKILETLNLSSNNDKNNKLNENEFLSKENQNKIINSKESPNKIDEDDDEEKKKYIKKYKSTDSRLYGITFQSSIENNLINVAVSSLNMNTNNNISILSFSQEEDNINQEENINNNINTINQKNSINLKSQIQCEFPVSSILFSPHEQNKNLLISTSDLLRLYSYENEKLSFKMAFTKRIKDYCGPLTACDWSRANNSIIGVCSVDTTCAIWDLNKLEVKYMIIAHDKEVYDISLGQDEFTFMSTGADGSLRLFDSRQANSSSIIFETRDAMTRLKWNLVNPNFILTVIVDKNEIYILD